MKCLFYPTMVLMGMLFPYLPQTPRVTKVRVLADFEAERIVIDQGQKVRFLDKSQGNPVQWSWRFENGLPAKAVESNPEVYYAKAGHYDVTITVSDGETYDTKVIEDYVKVKGILHHFRFDGLVRDEVNLNHSLGDWNKWGLVRDRNGAPGRALFLNPKSTLAIPDQGFFRTNELSVSFWLKTEKQLDQQAVILEKYNGREKDFGFRVLMKDGHLSFEGRDGSGLLRSTGPALNPIDDNQWHHVTAVMTSKSHWQLWIDGILEAEQVNSYTIPEQLNDADLTLGFSRLFESNKFEGALDELKIFNKALNMQSIVELASQ